MLKTLYVGVDVSCHRHDICLLSDEGNPLGKPFAIVNNRPGAQMLVERVSAVAADYERIMVGMEATGVYWQHLHTYLNRASALLGQPVQVVAFNPRLIHGFRGAYKAMDKTDPDDAFIIAERLRFGHLPVNPGAEARYFPLQRLTRYRYHLVHTLVRVKCYALDLLFLFASEYNRLKPFSDPFGAASMAVLVEYKSLDELTAVPLEELTEFIDIRGRRHFDDPGKPADMLKQVAVDSFELDDDQAEAVHFALRGCLDHVQFLQRQLTSLDRRIAKELEQLPNTLQSVPGLGPVYVAGILAEIGGIDRFDNDSALAKYAGLWWPRQQSGQFEAEDRSLSKAGNSYLRYYLCEAANSLRGHNEEYKQYYDRKYKETPKHPHKRATVLTARKLVRLVDALLRKNQLYHSPVAVSCTKNQR